MEHADVVNELINMLQKAIPKPREMSATTAMIGDIGLESIQVIEYLCDVEDRYDLIIDEDKLADVQTIGDLADVVIALSAK